MNSSEPPNVSLSDEIVSDVINAYSDEIISIYGIGSYFDDTLPSDWIKNDLDLVVIVNSLDNIIKPDWTEVRYEKKQIRDHEVWLGFNTLEGFQNKELFEKQSFSNYKWSLLDLKYTKNSKLLYGQDVREQLPEPSKLEFDYDDILARGLYHLDRSLKHALPPANMENSMKEYTKGVFKFGFYLCIYFDERFHSTSLRDIAVKLEELSTNRETKGEFLGAMKDAILFRRGRKFVSDFSRLRNDFIVQIISLLGKGRLHRKMNFKELLHFLESKFGGLSNLIQFAYEVRKKYYEKKGK